MSRVYVCSDPDCSAGSGRVRVLSITNTEWCCGQIMDRAMYRAAHRPDQPGKFIGFTALNVFLCPSCVGSVETSRRVIEAADVPDDRTCPDCGKPSLIRFGTPKN